MNKKQFKILTFLLGGTMSLGAGCLSDDSIPRECLTAEQLYQQAIVGISDSKSWESIEEAIGFKLYGGVREKDLWYKDLCIKECFKAEAGNGQIIFSFKKSSLGQMNYYIGIYDSNTRTAEILTWFDGSIPQAMDNNLVAMVDAKNRGSSSWVYAHPNWISRIHWVTSGGPGKSVVYGKTCPNYPDDLCDIIGGDFIHNNLYDNIKFASGEIIIDNILVDLNNKRMSHSSGRKIFDVKTGELRDPISDDEEKHLEVWGSGIMNTDIYSK